MTSDDDRAPARTAQRRRTVRARRGEHLLVASALASRGSTSTAGLGARAGRARVSAIASYGSRVAGRSEVAHLVERDGGRDETRRAGRGKALPARDRRTRCAVVPGVTVTTVRSASPRAIARNISAIAVE